RILVDRLLGGCVRVLRPPPGGLSSWATARTPRKAPMTGVDRISQLRAEGAPFALLARERSDTVEVLTGEVVDVDQLAEMPLVDGKGEPQEVLALVPYRQVRERGFTAHDDGAPLRCLIVRERTELPITQALAELPNAQVPLRDAGFDIADEEYA